MAPNSVFPSLKTVTDKPTLVDVASLITTGEARNIVIMAGAGISTAAGIPDFRSPDTGLYDNLEKYKLPYPEAIFSIDYFVEKPEAFYALAKEIYPGNFKPTLAHYFFTLLKQRKVLRRAFTQNIDTLERIAGLSDDDVVEAHGSFAAATCLVCKAEYTAGEIKPRIMQSEVDLDACDLLIVLGTSLTVHPFAGLMNRVPRHCPRVLMNLEAVGEASRGGGLSWNRTNDGFDFDGRTERTNGIRDVLYLGHADDGVRELARHCGWEEALQRLYDEGHGKTHAEVTDPANIAPLKADKPAAEKKSTDLEANVEKIAAEIGKIELAAKEDEDEVPPGTAAAKLSDLATDVGKTHDTDEKGSKSVL